MMPPIAAYDGIGNPISDGTWTYTWKHGRELSSMTKSSETWNYTYDADGLRSKKTNGTNTYTYVYDGGSLVSVKNGTTTIRIAYDGEVPAVLEYNGTRYHYVTNLQGDVVALVDTSGNKVVAPSHCAEVPRHFQIWYPYSTPFHS